METEKNSSRYLAKAGCDYFVEIPLKLPSINNYIDICRRNKYQASKYKKDIEKEISIFLNRLPQIKKPIFINFVWIEKDRRRDLDNLSFGKKFILDAMVKCGKIKDDSRRYVIGFSDTFEIGNDTKVYLYIEEVENGKKKKR